MQKSKIIIIVKLYNSGKKNRAHPKIILFFCVNLKIYEIL